MVVLMCEAAGGRLAIPVRDVVEVIARPRLEPLAGKPDWFAGLFAYRGQVTPVVELGRLMGGDVRPPMWSNRIVVVRVPQPAAESDCETLVGLLVDRAAAEPMDEKTMTSTTGQPNRVVPWGPTVLDNRGMFCAIELASILTPDRLAAVFSR
jgi:chemotaxis-related protein WspB